MTRGAKHIRQLALRIAVVCVLTCHVRAASPAANEADRLWREKVEPLLDRNCFKCHGGVRQKGGLDLRSLENLLKGGDNGPALIPGEPDKSHLQQFVQPGAETHMPPGGKKQLAKGEIELIRAWIATLPRTNFFSLPSGTNANWAGEYVRQLNLSRQPGWSPPPGLPATAVIDRFVELGWRQRRVSPAAPADDRTFARRLYLDLAGRVPTDAELNAYLRDRAKNKRERLVDGLLAGPDYPVHMREVFDAALMEKRGEPFERQRRDSQWFAFLERAFRENRPWNEVVRQLILARPGDEANRGAARFLYERENNHQAMAEAVAPVAFGVQIGCAQCHNHPLAAEVEQRHYWGLVAAFNRSKNVDSDAGPGLAEAATGGFVNFANLKKESQPAQLAFLNGQVISEKRPGENEKEADAPDLYVVPPPAEKKKPAAPSVPKFSRREALSEAATSGNPQLARAFVNRAWAILLGRGLVHPVDQIDSRHFPSHPDLLAWLATDFEKSGYDVKRLLHEIILSRAYQLDSRPRGRLAPPPEAFARAIAKPLSGEQFYHSLLTVTGNPIDAEGKVAGRSEGEVRRAFTARFPELFQTEYNASLQQATFLSNSPVLDDLLRSRPGNLTARLLALDSVETRVDQAFLAVYGRRPAADEAKQSGDFLRKRKSETGLKQLLWALLTSAEFQLNQ